MAGRFLRTTRAISTSSSSEDASNRTLPRAPASSLEDESNHAAPRAVVVARQVHDVIHHAVAPCRHMQL